MSQALGNGVAKLKQLGQAAGISAAFLHNLSRPKAMLYASIPVLMDDGSTQYFDA